MRFYCIGGDPNYPCFVLTTKGCTIMFDCSLNMKQLQYFMPQMLVSNQRFDNLPSFRSQSTGNYFFNVKEFNSRPFLNSTLEFGIPHFNLINIQDLDAVFISNYHTMLALPYLTRMPEFRAIIYCTEPTLHFGRMLMEEMTSFIKNNQTIAIKQNSEIFADTTEYASKTKTMLKKLNIYNENKENKINSDAKIISDDQLMDVDINVDSNKTKKRIYSEVIESSEENDLMNNEEEQKHKLYNWKDHKLYISQIFNINEPHNKPLHWKLLYDREDVDNCLARIKLVSFNERINVFGNLTVLPKSSGYCIGSCNWVIEASSDSILYLSRSTILQPNTHSKLYDFTFLKQQIVDSLLISGLNPVPSTDSETMIKELCRAALVTVKNQGSVLIPTYPTGKIYDIIEILNAHLGEALLGNIPIYFISNVANQSLAYSNIFAEWLCEPRLNATYAAEHPFQHSELVRNGFLKVFPSITGKFNDEFRQPCIIFASHPSCRFGDACHFVELLKNSPANSIIFIEPEFNYLDILAPFQPVYASYYYFPIDRGLNPDKMYKLLGDSKAINQIIMSNQYKLSNEVINKSDLLLKIDPARLPCSNVNFYFQNDVIKLLIKPRYENCDIETDLASMIIPTKTTTNNNMSFATFNAQLITKNNNHILKAAPITIPLNRRDRINESHLKKYAYGKISLTRLLSSMRQFNVNPTKFNGKDYDSSLEKDLLMEDEFMSTASLTQMYSIEIDKHNRIDLDINEQQIHISCDNEEIRGKIKECILKCVSTI